MTSQCIKSKPVVGEVGRVTVGLMIVYFYFSSVLLPLLSPLRNLGVLEPALIRNAFLPPLLIALVFSIGLGRVLKPRSGIQLLLACMFFLGLLVGIENILIGESYREYLSHMFQVFSAYVMFLVGWLSFRAWSERFWKYLILFSLISIMISSAFTINVLGSGDISRYYTAAYGFILISAYAANYSSSIALMAVIGSIISNKRAVVLAVLTMLMARFLGFGGRNIKSLTSKMFLSYFFKMATFAVILFFVFLFFVYWIGHNPGSGLSKAYNISINRILNVVEAIGNKSGFESLSFGRAEEIEVALNAFNGIDYIIGNGAGWNVNLPSGKNVQNIHFTPLSLALIYGFPVAIFFYFLIINSYLKFVFLRYNHLTVTEKIAPLYIVGALVHSFFAYSLFIDWLFFFFVGVMVRSTRSEINLKRLINNA